MFDWLFWLFEWEGIFPARAYCGDWSELHIMISKVSALVIFISYILIPLAILLAYNAYTKTLVVTHNVQTGVKLLAAFIVSCAMTHLMGGYIIFEYGMYRLDTLIKVICAGISGYTVLWLVFSPSFNKIKTSKKIE